MTVLDLTTRQLRPPLPLPGIDIVDSLAINPVTNQVAVLGSGKLFLVDLAELRLVKAIDLPTGASELAFDSATNTILIPAFTALFLIQPQALPAAPEVAPLDVAVRALDTGAPIEGATVTVKRTGLADSTRFNGFAFFTGVPVGPQTVTVSAAGFAPTERPVTIQAGPGIVVRISLVRQAAFGTLTGVVVSGIPPRNTSSATSAGESRRRNVTQAGQLPHAEPGPVVPDQALPSCAPANATPIPGATVALPSPGAPVEATTGTNGTFFLAQAPAGTVLVAVRAPGQNPTTQLATIEQGLENCIVVTLLPTLNRDPPTIALTLNAGSFRPNQTLTLDRVITLSASASPTQADEYILGVLPDGQTLLSLVVAPPGFAFGVAPFRTNVTVTAATGRVFQFTFSGGEPPGTYQAVGRLVKPGGNPFNPADWLNTTTANFTFGP